MANNGCATSEPHQSLPQAIAYGASERRPGEPAPHSAEGTRIASPRYETHPVPTPAAAANANEAPLPEPNPEPLIGTPFVRRQLPDEVVPPVGSGPRRYRPPRDEALPRKPLPRIYGRHRYLGYWYVPFAVALAIGTAFAIIWAAERLTRDQSASPAPSPTSSTQTTPNATATAPAFSTPAPSPTVRLPTPSATASDAPGKFNAGQRLTVASTGDCLNVRTKPGTENDAIVCLQDGAEVRVTGGPQQAGNYTWWKIQTPLGEGWAVEDYLNPAP